MQLPPVSLAPTVLNRHLRAYSGQTVYSKTYANFTGTLNDSIDLSTKPKGIYFIEIIADKKKEGRKIVVD